MENKVIALIQIILLLILGAFRIKFGEVIESILYRLDINSKVELMRLPLIHIFPTAYRNIECLGATVIHPPLLTEA